MNKWKVDGAEVSCSRRTVIAGTTRTNGTTGDTGHVSDYLVYMVEK